MVDFFADEYLCSFFCFFVCLTDAKLSSIHKLHLCELSQPCPCFFLGNWT